MKILKDNRGFTLVEMVVTMVVTSIMSIALVSIFTFVMNITTKYEILDEQAAIIDLIKTEIQTNLTYSEYVSLDPNFPPESLGFRTNTFSTVTGTFYSDTTAKYNVGVFRDHFITIEFSGDQEILTMNIMITLDNIISKEVYSFRFLNNKVNISKQNTTSSMIYYKTK